VPGYSNVPGHTQPWGTSVFNGVRQGATTIDAVRHHAVVTTEVVNPASWSPNVALDASVGTLYTDDFNRANGAPGANWTEQVAGAHLIVSNQLARQNVSSGQDFIGWATALPSDDHWVEADIYKHGTQFCVLHARADTVVGNVNCYMAFIAPGGATVTIGKTVAGVYSDISSAAYSGHADPSKLRLEVQGGQQRLYVDGVLCHTTNDTTITTGKFVGLNTNVPSGEYDNFATGVLVPSGSTGTSTVTGDMSVLRGPPLFVGQSDGISATTGALAEAKTLVGRSDGGRTAGTLAALIFEPFDDLTAWSPGAGSPTVVAGGRTGNGMQLTTVGQLRYTLPVPSQSDTVTVGFAFMRTAFGATANLFTLRSDAAVTLHVALQCVSDGSLQFIRNITPIGPASPIVIVANVWTYIEVQVKLHDTTGFVILRVNGTELINATGLDTKNAGTKTVFDTVELSRGTTTGNFLYDDVYIDAAPGTLKGDITVPLTPGHSAALARANALASTDSAGTSTVTGDLTVTRGPVTFNGQSDGTSSSTGTMLVLAEPLSGLASATSTVTGALTVAKTLAGQTDGTSTTTGALAVAKGLVGQAGGVATTTGALVVAQALVGSSAATSTTTGALAEAKTLFGSTAGVATTTGALGEAKTLVGSTAGASTVTGALRTALALAAISAGLATTTGTLTTAAPSAPQLKVWNGTAFVSGTVRVWNGTAFVDALAVKTWNGTAFV
jgi:hypothetical protein